MLTALFPSMRAATPSSGETAGISCTKVIAISPEDLNVLSAKIVEGLQAHVVGSMRASLKHLFQEHEQRLLAALVSVHSQSHPGSKLLTPVLKNKSRTNCSSNGHNSSGQPKDACTLDDTWLGGPRAQKNSHARRRSLEERINREMPARLNFNQRGRRWSNTHRETTISVHGNKWFQFQTAPSGVRSLEDARDTELLEDVQDRATALLGRSVPATRKLMNTLYIQACSERRSLSEGVLPEMRYSSTGSTASRTCSNDEITQDNVASRCFATKEPSHGQAAENTRIESHALGRNSQAHPRQEETADETVAAAQPPLPLPAELPAPTGSPMELPGAVTSRPGDHSAAQKEGSSLGLDRSSEGQQPKAFPSQNRSLVDLSDQLAAAVTAAASAVDHIPRGDSLNHRASVASTCQDDPLRAALRSGDPASPAEARCSGPTRSTWPAPASASDCRSPAAAAAAKTTEDLVCARQSQGSGVLPPQPAPSFRGSLSTKAFASDTQAVRLKRERELLEEFDSENPASLAIEELLSNLGEEMRSGRARTPDNRPLYVAQRLGSPLPLRLCGILPSGRLGLAYRYGVLLLAAALVAVFAEQFYHAQRRLVRDDDCTLGICMPFCSLSDLVLAAGSLLGLVAARMLASMKLLGSPTAMLAKYAIENDAVWKWSSATSWQSLYLAILWVGSLAFRVASTQSDPSPQEVVRGCAFMLVSLIFMALVFSILHVSCLISILIDSYVLGVKETMSVSSGIQKWDKLGALLRRVSRAVERSFLLVQITAMAMLLCSVCDLILQRGQPIWWFISNMLLAQSLVLLFFKAAEVTAMCTRVPSLINSLDFGGDNCSTQRHYLVEHITYSAAGFYVGEVRLTATMALKLVHFSVLAMFGVLTKLTTA